MAEPKKYDCEVCNHTNFIVPKLEQVGGNKLYITTCYYCETKFKVGNEALYIVPDTTSDKYITRLARDNKIINSASNNKEEISTPSPIENDKVPIVTYIFLGLLLIGLFFFVVDYFDKGSDSKIATTVSDFSQREEQVNTNTATQNLSESASSVTNSNCEFSRARGNALQKVELLNLHFVSDDELGTQEDANNCSVTYRFYVKEIGYDLEGKEFIKDKLKHLLLTYKKSVADFEFVEGKLFEDINTTKYRAID